MATVKRPRTTKAKKQAEPTPTAAPEVKAAPAPPKEVARVTTQAVNLHDAIRHRAYQLFQERGYSHGRHLDDWLRAESEVLARFGARSA